MEKYTGVSVRQLKNGSWQARLAYKSVGKWKTLDKVLRGAKSKREANKMAEDLRRELNAQSENDVVAKKTVEQVVRDYLDYQYSTGLLERSTYDNQIYALNKRIAPYIGDYSFETLNRNVIIAWHTKLAAEGLTQASIKIFYRILTKVYNYYEQIGEIKTNPFKQVRAPKSGTPKTTHMTDWQMNTFLSAVYQEYDLGDPILTAIILAYYEGLRRGEISGLRWKMINWDANTITIDTSVGNSSTGFYTKGVKNASSNRQIPMLPQVREVLQARYDKVNPEPNWYVTGDENFMTPNHFYKEFKKFVQAYDLRDAYGNYLTPHSLRHNFSSVGVRSGMEIGALSAMLGHASTAMTLDIYYDISDESKRVGMKRLAQTFKKTDLD